MGNFNFDPVEVPQGLRDAMYAAYEALAGKRAQVERLKAAHSSVLQEIANAKADLEQHKSTYVTGFVDNVSGVDADPAIPRDQRDTMTQIGGFIYSAEQTLPDFEAAIAKAEAEMEPLRRAYRTARYQVVRVIKQRIPKVDTSFSELTSFTDFLGGGGAIDLDTAMMLYLAVFDDGLPERGQPFERVGSPAAFFQFISSFFRTPSKEEVQVFRDRFNVLVWGDREPEPPVRMPEHPIPKDAHFPDFNRLTMGRGRC